MWLSDIRYGEHLDRGTWTQQRQGSLRKLSHFSPEKKARAGQGSDFFFLEKHHAEKATRELDSAVTAFVALVDLSIFIDEVPSRGRLNKLTKVTVSN